MWESDRFLPLPKTLGWLPDVLRINSKLLVKASKAQHVLAPVYFSNLVSCYSVKRQEGVVRGNNVCFSPSACHIRNLAVGDTILRNSFQRQGGGRASMSASGSEERKEVLE